VPNSADLSALDPALAAAFGNAFEHGFDPGLLVDDEERLRAANAAARRRLRLEPPPTGARIEDVLPAVAGADPWPALLAAARAGDGRTDEVRLSLGAFSVTCVAAPPGALHLLLLREAEPADAARAARLQAVVDSSHDAVILLDAEGLVDTVSARTSLVLGFSERALVGRPLDVVAGEGQREDLTALVRSALEGADVFQHDTVARHRDGRPVDVVVDLAPVRAPDGRVAGVSVIIQDITERKRLERALRHQSERDGLTGLYNRRHFEVELHRAVRLAERHGHGGAIVVLDVDRFKQVNDGQGHPAGDRLLRALAGALAASLRDSDVAARLGGDEFAVLLPIVDPEGAAATAQKLTDGVRAALRPWGTSASAGVAWFGPRAEPEQALAAADRALYRAKAAGGDALDVDELG
jgi:diguanylate cyclase (GGDEF)-like protein/PAS domain S-box-containing protein